MKRALALVLALTLSLGLFAGCNGDQKASSGAASNNNSSGAGSTAAPSGKKVTLNVFSTYAGNDGNAANYQASIAAWQQLTGNTLNDTSATVDDTVKAKIRTDFSSGSEPDLLFFFAGSDIDSFKDKIVTIEEIRKEYPDYANNINDSAAPIATDGKLYAVPVNGYWENMFVNKTVLKAAGVEVPGKDYTWDQFLADCEKIKTAGYTPIAASFVDVPHYWWEFTIYNNQSPKTHLNIPASTTDETGKQWVAGMNDIKTLYDKGYFPKNVLSEKDEALQQLLYTDKAAFMIDGSWRAGTIKALCNDADGKLDDKALADRFTVVNVPGKGERKATDMVCGMSSGWMISKKAWSDPDKKAACVEFVKYMTSDKMVTMFTNATGGTNALKNPVEMQNPDSMDSAAFALTKAATAKVPAVQDGVAGDARAAMFQAIPQLCNGGVTAEKLIGDFLAAFKK